MDVDGTDDEILVEGIQLSFELYFCLANRDVAVVKTDECNSFKSLIKVIDPPVKMRPGDTVKIRVVYEKGFVDVQLM